VVVRFAVVFGLLGLFQATLGPLIPLLRDRDHLSPATAGLLVTGFFGGCLISTTVGGALSERWVRGPFYVGATGLLLGGIGLLALPVAWPLPLVAVGIAGLGFGALLLIINTTMAAKGLSYVNLVNGTYGLGAAAGPALISLTHGGYLFALVGIGVLVALPLRIRTEGEDIAAQGRLRVDPTLLLFCGLLFCYAGVETGLSSWETVNLRAHGYAPDTASALTSLFWLGLAAGRFLVPLVTRAWTASRLITSALVACLGGLTLLATEVSAPIGFMLFGAFAGPVFPTTLAWIARVSPDPRRANAIVLAVAMLGNATVPALIGWGLQSTSALALPLFAAVALSGCVGIVVALRSRTRHAYEV
jgi:FHS family glucose/mannose:H+ symporter-like MFS transporter